jgi:mannose-6-phosphate isomerase-like protein (cupin superfamily)
MIDTNDTGPAPFVGSIEDFTLENTNYRTTMWTGGNLQVTLMSIAPGSDIGLEVHDTHDQFLRIEQGSADVVMGPNQNELMTWQAFDGDAVIVPAGSWHNLTCVGVEELKVYSIYAPPQHPHGTIHVTKEEAEAAEAASEPVATPVPQAMVEQAPSEEPVLAPEQPPEPNM